MNPKKGTTMEPLGKGYYKGHCSAAGLVEILADGGVPLAHRDARLRV